MEPTQGEIAMAEGGHQLPLVFELEPSEDAERGAGRRSAERQPAVRVVEYSAFPRVGTRGRPSVGFTRDVSDVGMCLGVAEEPILGSLLRVTVRELDGRRLLDALARVCWTRRRGDRSWWVGLSFFGEVRDRAVRVRPVPRRQRLPA